MARARDLRNKIRNTTIPQSTVSRKQTTKEQRGVTGDIQMSTLTCSGTAIQNGRRCSRGKANARDFSDCITLVEPTEPHYINTHSHPTNPPHIHTYHDIPPSPCTPKCLSTNRGKLPVPTAAFTSDRLLVDSYPLIPY
jgi:hypothetical protein